MQNTYDPLKQYLGTQGQDFSMANLQKLAASKGVSGYSGTDAQNQQLSSMLAPQAQTPAPQAAPQKSALVADTEPNEYNTINSIYGEFSKDPTQYANSQGVTEQSYRDKNIAAMQAQIDATNSFYANELQRARQQGSGRVGSGTAIQARRGLLGSDFGTAQTNEINQGNEQIYSSIEAEKLAKINAIRQDAEDRASKQYQEARTALEGGLKSRLEWLKGEDTRKKTAAQELAAMFVAQGIDPSSDNFDDIAKKNGVTTSSVKNAYMQSMYEAESKQKADQEASERKIRETLAGRGIENISEGSSGYRYNPQTDKYELVASNPKTYAPSQYNQESSNITSDTTNSVITNQPAFKRLRAKEQTQAVALENLIRELKLYRSDVGKDSVNLFGADSATVSSRLNSLLFAAAQAEGTGALQAADREVLEGSIPNPTTLGGAFVNVRQGGIEGVRNKIDTQINKYTANLKNLGLNPEEPQMSKAPVQGNKGVLVSPDGKQEVDISSLTPEELKEAQALGWQ